ncbi:MAG: glycosyltransferase [Coriobacteriales bacterium]|nr:glycosyltransferase [Coriobacteriales bacterium]
MSEHIDVSVIVPCYNTERFLDQALTSAEQNGRCSLEIIVLNDGSTDDSLDIMRSHASRDERVRIIDKRNQGYGATVNRGFDEARGTYVAILEPDDWVQPNMYDDLFEYATSFANDEAELPDIVKTPYWRVWMPTTPRERLLHCSYYQRINVDHQPFTLSECPRLVQHHPSIWSAIYRTDFLRTRNIRMREVPGAGWVDNPFLFETMCQAQSIVYLDRPYYCYREDLPGSSSATRVLKLSLERWHDMADIVDRLCPDDDGIRYALTVIGFRYAGEAIGRGALEDEELHAMLESVFSRMRTEDILALENVSPQLRRLAFELSNREVPKISGRGYAQALINEFGYSIGTNGVGFALVRTGVYMERRKRQDKRSADYVG